MEIYVATLITPEEKNVRNNIAKRKFTPCTILVLFFFLGTAFADNDSSGAESISDQLNRAFSEGDRDRLLELLDSQVIIFESGGMESSLEEYASHHMQSDMKFMANMTSEVISRQVIEEGPLAIVTTLSRFAGSYKEKPLELNSTETLVLKKGEQGWRILHIHWSSSEDL